VWSRVLVRRWHSSVIPVSECGRRNNVVERRPLPDPYDKTLSKFYK
jgi:hypothetical protein